MKEPITDTQVSQSNNVRYNEKSFLVIAGMPRSGTSFLARALNLCGVYLGDLDSLVAHEWRPFLDNRRGTWEHKKFVELERKILSFNRASWENVSENVVVNAEIVNELRNSVKELLNHHSLAAGIKVPEMILYLKSLVEYLPKDFVLIGIFRHPLKVAESLKTRDQWSYEKSLNLWQMFNHRLLSFLEEHNGFLLDFDWPKEKLLSEIHLIVKKLSLAENIDLSHWYTEELLHSNETYDSTYPLTDEITALYAALKRRSECNGRIEVKSPTRTSQDYMEIIQTLLTDFQAQGNYFRSINEIRSNNPMGSLLTMYAERLDLQAAFPEVKNGEYGRIIEWAVKYGTIIDGQKDLLMHKDWYRSQLPKIEAKKVNDGRNNKPMDTLLTMYAERLDLQAAFPEVKNGEYGRIIEWAVKYGTIIDGQKHLLLAYTDWYRSQLPRDFLWKRRFQELTITSVRIIKEEGIRSFFRKAFEKINRGDLNQEHSTTSSLEKLDRLRSFSPEQCRLWMSLNQPSGQILQQMRTEIDRLSYRPLISLCMSVYNPEMDYLSKALASVSNQIYDNWEFIIVDDASSLPHVRPLLMSFAEKDKRIHLYLKNTNEGAPKALNQALNRTKGDYVTIIDHDDLLEPHALYSIARYLNEHGRNWDLIYSDEALIDEQDKVSYIHFRPDFSPDFLLSHQYFNHLVAMKRSLLDQIGGYDESFRQVSFDYDLYLRIAARTTNIAHIPQVLYRWRRYEKSTSHQYKNMVMEQSKIAIGKAMKIMGIDGTVEDGLWFNYFRVKRRLNDERLSIIILTKDIYLLSRCLRSIEAKTKFSNYEIIVVAHNINDDETKEYLKNIATQNSKCRIVHYDKPFNFSAMNNYAARIATGQHLLFLNDDTEVLAEGSVEAMMEHSQREDVGAVGAKLLYPNNTIQHAGVIVGLFDSCEHVHKFSPANDLGYYGSLISVRNYSAVTAACIMIPKKVFVNVGGFDEQLGIVFNDIDLCLRIRKLGYLIVYTPYALLYHYEHATRKGSGPLHPHREDVLFRKRWKSLIQDGDPYYNPNLSRRHFDCRPHL